MKENKGFIEELVEQSKIFKVVCLTLKNKGFGYTQKELIFKELSLQKDQKNVKIFTENILQYLANLVHKGLEINEK